MSYDMFKKLLVTKKSNKTNEFVGRSSIYSFMLKEKKQKVSSDIVYGFKS